MPYVYKKDFSAPPDPIPNYQPQSMGENTFGSVHPFICVFVYALPFEPVVRSRSILGLSLPSSANGKCEWPLPVHWNCLFVSNQGAFNVSHLSGRSALMFIKLAAHINTVLTL